MRAERGSGGYRLIPNTRHLPCCGRTVRIRTDLTVGQTIGTNCCGRRWVGTVTVATLPDFWRIDWHHEIPRKGTLSYLTEGAA